ncbi:MAG: diphthamide synthesis protein, partial [Nitrososphaerales archaeon]
MEESHPSRIVFNAPDGLLQQTRTLAKELESSYDLQAIVIADPTYGSCDTVDIDAQRLGADLAFHVGHNITVRKFGKITYSIDAYDDISFDKAALELVEQLRSAKLRSVGLTAFAQHIRQIEEVSMILEQNGFKTLVGKGMGQLHTGQIFGCEFYPAYNIRNEVDAMALLGQSMFHAIGLCLSTGKPTFMLDPYLTQAVNVQKTAEERLKRAVLSIYKAQEARKIAIIIGLKEGQIMTDQSIKIKAQLEQFGKQVSLIAL